MRKFNNSTKFFTLLIGTIVIILVWATSVSARSQLTDGSQLAINGIGPIRVGMTVAEASRSAGVTLVKSRTIQPLFCTYLEPLGGPKGIDFMVIEGRIATVDIRNKRVTTIKGAKIGDSEERIFALYPGQIQATKSLYSHKDNKDLTFVPKDAADQNYRMIFEITNHRVTSFRSGKFPAVKNIAYCYC
jgi:hypothetical protein